MTDTKATAPNPDEIRTVTGMDDAPIEWRELLAEIFAEAERKGLGAFAPGFTAAAGREQEAAAFIGQRAEHLSEIRLGGGL